MQNIGQDEEIGNCCNVCSPWLLQVGNLEAVAQTPCSYPAGCPQCHQRHGATLYLLQVGLPKQMWTGHQTAGEGPECEGVTSPCC